MKISKTHLPKFNFLLGTLIIFSAFFLFFQLGDNKLIEYDEGIYGVVSQNILKTGDFLTLTWKDGNAWFDKGPFYFWLSAASIKIFGQTAFAVRFFSAFFGYLSVFLVFLIGKRLFSERVGLISGFILASSTGYLYYARLGMLDVPTAFFISFSLYFLIVGREHLINDKLKLSVVNYSIVAVAISGAFLLRGFVGLIGVVSFALFVLVFDGFKGVIKNIRQIILPALIFFTLSAPWHVLMYLKHGDTFLTTYFGHQMFSRFAGTIEGKSAPRFWYLAVIRTQFRIWFVPLIPAFFLGIFQFIKNIIAKNKKEVSGLGLILIWATITFMVFTIANSKLIWYILPIYPALSLLSAWFIEKAFTFATRMTFLPEVSLIVLVLSISIFYNIRMWERIKTEDFNNEAFGVIEAKNRIARNESLCCADVGWSVCQFYASPALAIDTKVSDLDAFLKTKCTYGIVSRESLKSLKTTDVFNIVSELGDYLLLTSRKSDKI